MCGYCQHEVNVADAMTADAATDAARVRSAANRRAEAERTHGLMANTQAFIARGTRRGGAAMGVVICIIGGWLATQDLPVYVPSAAVLVGVACIAFSQILGRRAPTASAQVPVGDGGTTDDATCSNCGGPMLFDADAIHAQCPMCFVTGIAPDDIRAQLAHAAERDAHDEEIRTERAMRLMQRRSSDQFPSQWKPRPEHPWHAALTTYASSRGLELKNSDALTAHDWLDTYWWGASTPYVGLSNQNATRWHLHGRYGLHPILIVYVIRARYDRSPEFTLFLAAPAFRSVVAQHTKARDRARFFGLDVVSSWAGVILTAHDADARHFEPNTLDEIVATAAELTLTG